MYSNGICAEKLLNGPVQTNTLLQKDEDRARVPRWSRSSARKATLILEDGTEFEGISFGYEGAVAGEVVFSTGMVGYPEALSDASFTGQILVMTYPLIGNYGVPEPSLWEDERMHVSGLIVSQYIETPSHHLSTMTLRDWLWHEQVPALEITDTRLLTQHIRRHGTMLGKIVFDNDIPFYNPYTSNLVQHVSSERVTYEGEGDTTLLLIDCGAKRNIIRSLLARGIRVITVPWNCDIFAMESAIHFDGIVVSNGPGNPLMVTQTIQTMRTALARKVPVLGICLGHQLLALAAGGETYKLKFGHRSQNQPCLLQNSARCYITTQNHGFAVQTLPPDFVPWFTNANDGSNEGMQHTTSPFLSVQFHPEAAPGPMDTEWIFDYFLEKVKG